LSVSLQLKWTNTMERRRSGYEVLLALLTLLLFSFTSATASSSHPTQLHDHVEQPKRNLLANGLGRTPPMGYVSDLCSVTQSFFFVWKWVFFFFLLALSLSVSLFITYKLQCSSTECLFMLWIVLARILGEQFFFFFFFCFFKKVVTISLIFLFSFSNFIQKKIFLS